MFANNSKLFDTYQQAKAFVFVLRSKGHRAFLQPYEDKRTGLLPRERLQQYRVVVWE